MNGVITADIANSTALEPQKLKLLTEQIKEIFSQDSIEFYRGDSFQVFIEKARAVLKKSITVRLLAISYANHARSDIRMSIRLGVLKNNLEDIGSNMEELFISSGRIFDKFIDSSRKTYISCGQESFDFTYEILAAYLDSVLEKITPRQAEVIFHALSGKSQVEIAALLKKTTATISQHVKTSRLDEINDILSKFDILTKQLEDGV